jgi:hypothetical protein
MPPKGKIMSYARTGEDGSDVYLYSDGEAIVCIWPEESEIRFLRISEAIAHLRDRQGQGMGVPDYVFERLEWEQEHYGDLVETRNQSEIENPFIREKIEMTKKHMESGPQCRKEKP